MQQRMKPCIVLLSFIAFWMSQIFCSQAFADANTWEPFNNGLTSSGRVSTIAVNPIHPAETYAATFFGGLYKTPNAAKIWNSVSNDVFEGTYISDVIFNPRNTNEIYVSTEQKGILKTIDGGQHWQQMNAGLNTSAIGSLAINPKNPNELYAASFFEGFFKTVDGGNHWIKLNVDPNIIFFGRVKINPNMPNIILLQVWKDFDRNYLYKSIDNGQNWSELKNTFYTYTMSFAPTQPQFVYACGDGGFYKSENAGETWQLLFHSKKTKAPVSAFLIDPNNPQTIYINVQNDGVYKTVDEGKTWFLLSEAFIQSEWIKFAINPSNSKEIYLTTDDGLFHSEDAGLTWNQSDNGMVNLSVISLASTPDLSKIYAGTVTHGLWINRNNQTWEPADVQFAHDTITQIVIDPTNSANVIMLVNKDPHSLYSDIYHSHDGGQIWQKASITLSKDDNHFIPKIISFNPINSNEVFVGEWSGGAIWKSIDNGQTWNQWSKLNNPFEINAIVINPKNPAEIYVGTEGISGRLMQKSTDGGKTWMDIPYDFGKRPVRGYNNLSSIAIDPKNPKILYAAAHLGNDPEETHLYKSIDSGQSWKIVGTGLPSDIELINTIIVNPIDTQILYAATGYYFNSANLPNGEGVYVSYDAGENWSPFNSGLNNPLATALSLGQDKLYVGTQGSGVSIANVSSLKPSSNKSFMMHQFNAKNFIRMKNKVPLHLRGVVEELRN